MIPVLIVLGSAAASAAGLFVGAAATAAAHEVVQESKNYSMAMIRISQYQKPGN